MLAIETATEACSVALFRDGLRTEARYEVIGRGHAERLVPMIAELPDKGRAERILVSLGPGSFTGVRIGLAAARALGLAWGAEVLGYPTLQLVAHMDVACGPLERLSCENPDPPDFIVCMAGGHGEWFVQPFNPAREPIGPARSMRPADAVEAYPQPVVVGSRAHDLVALRGSGKAYPALPDALYAGGLPDTILTTDLAPIYGRPPDARLPA
ncbi:MAG TPA: tRNA (adenosine(37)-N6)-threonylcarbamoyltransferase complex dimerization subunit type 1 TsaB [Croceibacterium sp.]|nr:tRNA (adenosine(37)-N6)-threonylcarbamoyltransferase complex dimerization subunit type 1 TsaB [Croceibacterium sp.]